MESTLIQKTCNHPFVICVDRRLIRANYDGWPLFAIVQNKCDFYMGK